jgi:hypothetical protein
MMLTRPIIRKLIGLFILVSCPLQFHFVNAADQASLQLSSDSAILDPVDYMSVLVDPFNSIELEEAVSASYQSLNNNSIDFGFTKDKHWLKFSVENIEPNSINKVISTSARFMRPLDVYLRRENGEIETLLLNNETNTFPSRPLSQFRLLAVEFTLEAQEKAEIFINFGAGGRATLILGVTNIDQVVKEQNFALVAFLPVAMILLTLVFVNLFHFISVRDFAYGGYVLYEINNIINLSHVEGFACTSSNPLGQS